MRMLLELDENNYSDTTKTHERFAVRGVICRDGKYAMQQARDGFYKILGGGIDKGETHEDAVVREVQEESGLIVIRDSIKPVGEVLEVRRDIYEPDIKYICHTYVYTCDVSDEMSHTSMTESEIRDGYHLAWAGAGEILEQNSKCQDKKWIARDTKIIEMLQNSR